MPAYGQQELYQPQIYGQPVAQQPFPPGHQSYFSYPHSQTSSGYQTAPSPYYPSPPLSQSGVGSGWQTPNAGPPSLSPPAWQPPLHPSLEAPRRHNSAPAAAIPGTDVVLDGNGDPIPPHDPNCESPDEFESEFDSECYYFRHPDEINPNFSLGVTEWKAPQPGRRALPATFREAELEAIAPRKPRPSDVESVSDYFTIIKREESLLSVRQTDEWGHVKDDLIFREFSRFCAEFLTLPEMQAMYRSRIDPEWEENDYASSRASTPAFSRPQSRGGRSMASFDDEMDLDCRHRRRSIHSREGSEEQRARPRSSFAQRASHSRDRSVTHSRSGSAASHTRTRLTRPKPLPPLHDQNQEDILAALGVTGSAKLVYETPGPAFGPPPTEAQRKTTSRTNSVSSATDSLSRYPSSTPQVQQPQHHHMPPRDNRSPSVDPWTGIPAHKQQQQQPHPQQHQQQYFDYRPNNSISQPANMLPDVDFSPPPPASATIWNRHANDNEATPRPKFDRNETRKRSFADAVGRTWNDGVASLEDEEDLTPKPKRQLRVDEGTTR